MEELDITDLDFNSNNMGFETKSSNFGGGLELLMNDKIKETSSKSDIELDDLNNLENELNDLVGDIPESSFSKKSDIFSKPIVSFDEKTSFKINKETSHLGQSTFQTDNDNKTWDGYGKFNNIPLNPDRA